MDSTREINNDNDLWEKVRAGEVGMYEILFRRYYQGLCLFAKRYTNDLTMAREVVQDLFVHIWEHREKIEIRSSFKTYIYSAARFNSIRRIENERRYSISLDDIPEPEPVFFDDLEYSELQAQIQKAIDALPSQCGKIFKMSRFDQLTYAEIASQLNLSVKTIEAQISKALRLIQQSLDVIILLMVYFSLFF